jgi:hypothetical protein
MFLSSSGVHEDKVADMVLEKLKLGHLPWKTARYAGRQVFNVHARRRPHFSVPASSGPCLIARNVPFETTAVRDESMA